MCLRSFLVVSILQYAINNSNLTSFVRALSVFQDLHSFAQTILRFSLYRSHSNLLSERSHSYSIQAVIHTHLLQHPCMCSSLPLPLPLNAQNFNPHNILQAFYGHTKYSLYIDGYRFGISLMIALKEFLSCTYAQTLVVLLLSAYIVFHYNYTCLNSQLSSIIFLLLSVKRVG